MPVKKILGIALFLFAGLIALSSLILLIKAVWEFYLATYVFEEALSAFELGEYTGRILAHLIFVSLGLLGLKRGIKLIWSQGKEDESNK